MRIGINASFARKPNTGIGQVTINFLKELAKQKTKHEFVLYLEENLPAGLNLSRKFQRRVFLPLWKRDDLIRKIWWEKQLLPAKVERDKCDVFLSLYQCPTVIGKKINHLMVVHDIIPKFFPEYLNNSRKKAYQKMTESAIRKTDKIISVSKRTEKDLIHFLDINARKITVNYPDVDEIYKGEVAKSINSKILKKYKLKPGYILNGGGLEVRKNAEGVIRAYKLLFDKNKKEKFSRDFPKLVITGKLMPELAPLVTDVEKIIKELNLTKQVRLLDFVPQKDLPAIYKNALMFLYPSQYEGFGLPVLEAMNQGTPVITSKITSLPEVGADAALYCNPDDAYDIAMVMKNLILNKKIHETLSKRGKERAKYFSWQKFTEKILHIIDNLK